jgi:hypothetical protein
MERRYRTADPLLAAPQPAVVRTALKAPGQFLDPPTRAFMESRFGDDFSGVRVHTDAGAAGWGRAVHANAYAVGNHVVFGAGRYSPSTPSGKTLLAHELAHVVQQSQGPGANPEPGAKAAAEHVGRGDTVSREALGGASPGLHAQDADEETHKAPATTRTLRLNWDELYRPGMFQPTRPFSLGVPGLGRPTFGLSSPSLSPGLTPPLLTPPSLLPGLGAPRPTLPALMPPFPSTPQSDPGGTAELPSRLPVLSSGQFSLGLRLGFPEAEAKELPHAPPSALQLSLQRAQIMNQMLTGSVPSGWEAIDKAKLASAIWGIFSTHIAPDVARSITRGLTVPTGPGRLSLELDLVLLTDFSGGGLSFTLRH